MTTESINLPAGPERAAPRRGRTAAVVAVVVVLAGIVGSMFVQIDYVALKPGSAHPTSELVAVSGVESFPPAAEDAPGEIAFTTVSVVDRVTIFQYVLAQLDGDTELFARRDIFQGSFEEVVARNAEAMINSKQTAARVALQELGYDVPLTLDGLRVLAVVPDSAAEGVIEVGDVITELEGEPIDLDGELAALLDPLRPGDDVTLTVEDATGEDESIEIELGTLADPRTGEVPDPDQGGIGVILEPRDVSVEFPFEIEIDSGDVGGPSAGLAFTLAVLDHLTPGPLTAGHRIAVTGTIQGDGTVGVVGGVPQKAAAVRAAGYDYFIVPQAEVDQARQALDGRVSVIGVSTLRDALDALESLAAPSAT